MQSGGKTVGPIIRTMAQQMCKKLYYLLVLVLCRVQVLLSLTPRSQGCHSPVSSPEQDYNLVELALRVVELLKCIHVNIPISLGRSPPL